MQTKKANKKKIFMISIVCVVIIALVATLALRPKKESYNQETAKIQDIITFYSFSGNIEAKDSQTVVSGNMLPIKKLYVKEGDLVKKGDVLFILDESDVAANIDQSAAGVEIAKINYEKMKTTTRDQQLAQVSNTLESAQLAFNEAKVNLERMEELFHSEAISKQDLEQAQKGYDTTKLQLESAQNNYDITEKSVEQNVRTAKEQLHQADASYQAAKSQVGDLKITAEIDGEISEIYVKENESLITGTKIMDIVNYDDLEVKVKVDEFDLGSVSEGKEVTVTINPLEKDIVGKVSKISKQAETVNGVSFFTASIDLEKDEALRVGLSVEVKAVNKNITNATTISMKALQFDNENRPFVYYRDINDNVVTKAVKVGANDGNTVEIIEGIKVGEVILFPEKAKGITPQMTPPSGMGANE